MVDIQDSLFGTLAVRAHFVLSHQVDEALALQLQFELTGKRVPRLGEILAAKGYMTPDQVRAVLQGQNGKGPGLFGEIAARWYFCTAADVEAALQQQREMRERKERPQRVGEILCSRGAMKPHQVRAVLQAQGKQIVQCPACFSRYNAVNIQMGTQVTCPRCRKAFVPLPFPIENVLEETREDEDVRADITMALPAVKDPPASDTQSLPSMEVGPYRLVSRLGADHSGILYKAFHPQTGNTVALRLFSSQAMQGAEEFDRWISAGQAAAELDHPNLQRILSMSSENGRAILVMEYVEGQSLRQRLQERGRIPALEAIDILIQCGEALAYGHSRDLIHGDLRPSHILIGLDGRVRVMGLGTPKRVNQDLKLMATKSGQTALPLYTPPEVLIDEENADERSDIYALAAIGYHLITGRAPQEGADLFQAGLRAASEEILPVSALDPRVPPYLNRLLLKALLPEPDDRYPSITALLADLRKCRAGLLIQAPDLPEIATEIRPGVPRTTKLRAPARRTARRSRTHKVRHGAGGHKTGKSGSLGRAGGSGTRYAAVRTPRFSSPIAGTTAVSPETSTIIGPVIPTSTDEAFETAMAPAASTAQAIAPVAEVELPDPTQHKPPEPTGDVALQELLAEDQNAATPSALAAPGAPTPVMNPGRRALRRTYTAPPPPRSPEISTTAIAIFSAILLIVVSVGIWTLRRPDPEDIQPQAVETQNLTAPKPLEPAAERQAKYDLALEIEKYISEHATDHQGIVERLDLFLGKYEHSAPQTIERAKELRHKHAQNGVTQSLPDLQVLVQQRIGEDKYREAQAEVTRWKNLWGEEGAAAAAQELDLVKAKEKTLAENLISLAQTKRKAGDWAAARTACTRVMERFAPEYAERARAEQREADQAETAAKSVADADAERKHREQAAAERETAAPARLAKLQNEVHAVMAHMDLEEASALAESAGDGLIGTGKGKDLQVIKADLKLLESVRDRMVKGAKAGKLRTLRIKLKDAEHPIVDAHPSGPIVDVGAGRTELKWTELQTGELSEIAQRVTNASDGPELFGLGMLLYYMGRYADAERTVKTSAQLGVPVEGRLAEIAARAKDGGAAKIATSTTENAPPLDAAMVQALKPLGWEVSKGQWTITSERTLLGVQSGDLPVITLKRTLPRFTSVSVEMRGDAESAGFSFGKGNRFVVKPSNQWQKLTLEVYQGDRLRLTLDGKPVTSAEDPGNVTSDQLADELFLRGKGTRIEFRAFAVDGVATANPVASVAPPEPEKPAPPPGPAPVQDGEAVKALNQQGWEISKGVWTQQGDVLLGQNDASTDFVSLKRAFKTCKTVSVQLRGSADAAGFSFGKGQRFVVKPSRAWQTLVLQLHDSGPPGLTVDGDARSSLEDTSGIKTSELGDTIYLRGVGGNVEFKNFKVE